MLYLVICLSKDICFCGIAWLATYMPYVVEV